MISRFTPDDWAEFARVRLESLRQNPEAFGSAYDREVDLTEADWRERLDEEYFVAARDAVGAVIGTGGSYESEDRLRRVVAMWVEPGHRGRGVGAAILADVVAHARLHADRIELWVADANPARRIYERFGFRGVGVIEPVRPGSAATKELLTLEA